MGVRMFDLRLRWDKDLEGFVTAHGIVIYSSLYWVDLDGLNITAKLQKQPIYIRVLLEDSGREDVTIDGCFALLCRELQREFKNLTFIGGFPARKRWRQKLFDFGTEEPSIDEQHVSVSGKWWQFIPRWWSAWNNGRVKTQSTDKQFLMIDFV